MNLNDSMWRFWMWKGEFQRFGRGIHHYTLIGGVADGDCVTGGKDMWKQKYKYHGIRNRQDPVSAKT